MLCAATTINAVTKAQISIAAKDFFLDTPQQTESENISFTVKNAAANAAAPVSNS
jgi:hypothetical protein